MSSNGFFLEFFGFQLIWWVVSYEFIEQQLKNDYEKVVVVYDKLKEIFVKYFIFVELYLYFFDWKKQIEKLNFVEFGLDYFVKKIVVIQFCILLQLLFNKDFNLFIEDLVVRKKEGFSNLIFFNQQKQVE